MRTGFLSIVEQLTKKSVSTEIDGRSEFMRGAAAKYGGHLGGAQLFRAGILKPRLYPAKEFLTPEKTPQKRIAISVTP